MPPAGAGGTGGKKPVKEVDGYRIGQHGCIDVLDRAAKLRRWVEGEIGRLIPIGESTGWALIETRMGGYRLW